MTPRLVACTKCRAALPPVLYNTEDLRPCPACGARTQVEVFPAALRPPGPSAVGETILAEGEASCFYHPNKKAVIPCESCGRFLCAICDVDLNGQHLCPSCLESGKKKGKLKQLDKSRTLYDGIALVTAFFLGWTVIGALIALYLSIRHWNSPSSVLPRSKWRFVVAILLSLIQLGGFTMAIVGSFNTPGRH